MDSNLDFVNNQKVNRTIENLKKNNIEGYYVADELKLKTMLSELIKEGDTITVGGSMTLFEIGVIDFIKDGNYNYLDRYKEGITPQELKEVYRGAFSADTYLVSSNAITENGELYNVDGRGNRVAAMIFGPDQVIVIIGINKIVKDLDEAIKRNRELSAPANNVRLNTNNPCTKTGYCMDCKSKNRICNDYVLIRRQSAMGRIKVIIVGKELGY